MLDLKGKELIILEKENEIRQKSKLNLYLIISSTLLVFIIIIIVLVSIGLRQRAQLKLKQQILDSAREIITIEEKTKVKIGVELHDHLGFLTSFLKESLEAVNFPDQNIKNEVKKNLNEISETVRRISHRLTSFRRKNEIFTELFAEIIQDFKQLTGCQINYFIPDYFPVIDAETTLHLSRIIEELLANALKHAPGSLLWLDLAFTGEEILIIYKDKGSGFIHDKSIEEGIGIKNIYARIKILGGVGKLTSSPGKGTEWEISIPVTNKKNFD